MCAVARARSAGRTCNTGPNKAITLLAHIVPYSSFSNVGTIKADGGGNVKVFWSWQSDHPGQISRHFVREALELAILELSQSPEVQEAQREVSLDHDRKGVSGSPDLASTILDKIRASDVIVADVTPVGATGGEAGKKLINSNVAIELGYSLGTLSDRRLIMVMNTYFGNLADLPFDLRHKAGPIIYSLAPEADKAVRDKVKKQLSGALKAALREMLALINPAAVNSVPTPLIIEFDHTSAPYVYDVRVENASGPLPGLMPASTYRCYRFSVTNRGHQVLRSCTAQISVANADDGAIIVGMPITLRMTDTGNATFPLRIGQKKFVDVLAIPISGPAKQWGAKFGEAGSPWPTPGARVDLPIVGAIFPPQAGTITIQVLSEGPPAIVKLRHEMGPDGLYQLRKLP